MVRNELRQILANVANSLIAIVNREEKTAKSRIFGDVLTDNFLIQVGNKANAGHCGCLKVKYYFSVF